MSQTVILSIPNNLQKGLTQETLETHDIVRQMINQKVPTVDQMAPAYCLRDSVYNPNDDFVLHMESQMKRAFMKNERKEQLRQPGSLLDFYLRCTESELVCMGW